MKEKVGKIFFPIISLTFVIIIWFLAAKSIDVEILLPSPSVAFKQLLEVLGSAEFYKCAGWTVLRSIFSFLLAGVFAFAIALLSSVSKTFKELIYPLIVILRAVPTISVIFIMYVSVKQNNRSLLIAFLVIFPTLYSAFYSAITSSDKDILQMSKVYKVNRKYLLQKYLIPHIFKSAYPELVNGISITVKLVVAAEALTQTKMSLGNLMYAAKLNFEMGTLLAYTLVAVILSFLLELLFGAIKYFCSLRGSK